jgi:hypothetical protein
MVARPLANDGETPRPPADTHDNDPSANTFFFFYPIRPPSYIAEPASLSTSARTLRLDLLYG